MLEKNMLPKKKNVEGASKNEISSEDLTNIRAS